MLFIDKIRTVSFASSLFYWLGTRATNGKLERLTPKPKKRKMLMQFIDVSGISFMIVQKSYITTEKTCLALRKFFLVL